MAEIADLLVRIEANALQLRSELAKAERDVDHSAARMRKDVMRLDKAFTNIGREGLADLTARLGVAGRALGTLGVGGVVIGATVAGLAAVSVAAKNAADQIGAIGDQAEMAGVAVEAFQELEFAARKYSVTQEALTDGLKELALRTDEFVVTGAGPAAEAFARLGFTQAELQTKLQDTPALLEEIADRMQGLDRAAQIRLADEIFGGQGGEQFVQLLARGGDEIARLRREARAAGAVVSGDLVAQADEMRDRFNEAAQLLSRQINAVLIQTAPLLELAAAGAEKLAAGLARVNEFFSDGNEAPDRPALPDAPTQPNATDGGRGLDPEAQTRAQRIRDEIKTLRVKALTYKQLADAARRGAEEVEALSTQQEIQDRATELGIDATSEQGREYAKLAFAAARAEQEYRKISATMTEGKALREDLRTAQERYNDEMERLGELLKAGAIDQETYGRAAKRAQEELAEATKKNSDFAKDLGLTFESAFENAIVSGKGFRDVLKGIEQDLARIVIRKAVTEPLGNAVGEFVGGIDFGGLFGGGGGAEYTPTSALIGSGQIKGFADGGDPPVGVPSLVGERGPELFVPKVPGTIIPNHKLGAMQSGAVTKNVFNCDLRGADAEAVRRLEALVARVNGSIERRAVAAVADAARRGGTVSSAIRGR